MNEQQTRAMLEDTYVAQVLSLAQAIKTEKSSKGTHASLSGCITEAQNLVDAEREQILARIAHTR
ncbi:MAG: hypothetical protein HY936_08485 [Nitrosomonadales bacterium]|nr:hypothetical protein [Nitrosomonadales bacterium]